MADFRWIQVSLFVIAVLQFPEAEGFPLFTVRAGQEVTLPCEDVIDDQQNCDSTTWLFINSSQRATVELIRLGQIVENSKSDGLSVTQNCSLVIKKLTHEDAGSYYCEQYKSGRIHSWYDVDLFVVTMTEHKINDQVVWSCSVSTCEWCAHTVKWLFEGKDVDEDHKDLQTSQSDCSASVTFTTSHFIHTSNSDLLTCEVTHGDKVQLFPFRLQPSGEEPGDTTTKQRPEPTTKTPPPTATTKPPTATTKPPTATATTKPPTATTKTPTDDSADLKGLLRFIIVSVGLAALIIIVVAVSMWTRTKGRKTQMDETMAADDEDDGAVNYENVTSSV
uniref:Ig-like domain-containing protein n=1 Tax=Larimichthys crocea TaxID=215358 RepID=A0A0F8ASF4_LARCR